MLNIKFKNGSKYESNANIKGSKNGPFIYTKNILNIKKFHKTSSNYKQAQIIKLLQILIDSKQKRLRKKLYYNINRYQL